MAAETSEELLHRFSGFVEERMGLHFPETRLKDLERGVERAYSELGFGDAESCMRGLMLSPLTKAGIEILAGHLTVGETYFFRDKRAYEIIEGDILPELIRRRRETGKYLRVWSAGCASGEEPYSIAMLLRRMIPDLEVWNVTILATDINPFFLGKASKGVYGEWSFRDVPSWVKERYFRRTENGRYSIIPDIKKQVTFSYHNLAEDAYPSLTNNTNAMDIIFCRNVIMYFSRDQQRKVWQKLSNSLVNGGWLIVSPAETSSALPPLVQMNFSGATLYRKDSEVSDQGPGVSEPGPVFLPTSVPMPPFPSSPAPDLRPPTSALRPPTSDPGPGLLAEALSAYEGGRYAEAEEKIAPLLVGNYSDAQALTLLARVYANEGRADAALELCGKAIAIDKLDPGRYYLLANIQQEMGLTEESAASLRRALYADQNFALAHFALGNLARRQGKAQEAVKHFENALSILGTCLRDEIIPESDGITAERLTEIIKTTMTEETLT